MLDTHLTISIITKVFLNKYGFQHALLAQDVPNPPCLYLKATSKSHTHHMQQQYKQITIYEFIYNESIGSHVVFQ